MVPGGLCRRGSTRCSHTISPRSTKSDSITWPADYRYVRALAADIADHLAVQEPDLLTTAQREQRRGDRIFLDINRTAYGQTAISPYSLRARPGALVDWSELGRSTPAGYDIRKIRQRLARKKDPWSAIGSHSAAPATVRGNLDAIAPGHS